MTPVIGVSHVRCLAAVSWTGGSAGRAQPADRRRPDVWRGRASDRGSGMGEADIAR